MELRCGSFISGESIRFYRFTWLKYLEALISARFRGLERATDLLFAPVLLLSHIAASRAQPQ